VTGIELSAAMVEHLRAKPGGERLPVTIGDMATAVVGGNFALVYLVFNTIVNLTTQDAQVDCFVNAASHLRPGGCFVVEVNVPPLRRLPPGDEANVFATGPEHWGIDVIDVVGQRLVSHHFTSTADGVRHESIPFRYVWPAELDLMARIAGLRLRDRWGDWSGGPYTASSRSHVSVWEKPRDAHRQGATEGRRA
jgi:SAM-dependent methyltransferase